MSGIALIIPGADYSQSSLGKVTFKKTSYEEAEEIVTAYEAIIGTSSYHSALSAFVKGCIDNDVWDGMLGFYPMIGDTLQKLSANLKNDGIPISLLENASAGSNYIRFVNTIAVTTPTVCEDSRLYDETEQDYIFGNYAEKFIFARTKPLTNTINTAPLFYYTTTNINGLGIFDGGSGRKFGFYNSYIDSTHDNEVVDYSQYVSYMGKMFGTKSFTAKFYKNGVYLNERTGGIGPSAKKLKATNQLGCCASHIISSPFPDTPGTTVSASAKLYNGDINLFAFGNLPDNKVTEFNTLVNALVEALGK